MKPEQNLTYIYRKGKSVSSRVHGLKTKRTYTAAEMLQMDPQNLLNYIASSCVVTIPISVETEEEERVAADSLAKASAYYSFLSPLRMQARIMKRMLKRQKADPAIVEDMLTREEIFGSQMDLMQQCYNTVSRLFTVKAQMNKEYDMQRHLT